MSWFGSDRTQDGHFPTTFVQAAENGRQHTDQAGQYDKNRYDKQGFFSDPQQAPQLLQGNTGQDGLQWLVGKLIDVTLYSKCADAILQAQ